MMKEGVNVMSDAFQNGYNAYFAYVSWELNADVNPYDPVTQLEDYKNWNRGWDYAEDRDYEYC